MTIKIGFIAVVIVLMFILMQLMYLCSLLAISVSEIKKLIKGEPK
jgi:uncharacterized membrane protein YcaP (DUF421 family)